MLWLTSWPAIAQAAGTFYVDAMNPSASDSNPGTQTLPFLTISGASAAQSGPGTTILVNPGVYRETVHIQASGTAAAPFVFRATGPGVVLEGADDFSTAGLWSQVSGNVYVASSVTWSVFQVFVDGERLGPSTAAPSSIPSNTFQYVPGAGLYVNAGGGSPGARQTFVGHRLNAFTASARTYVTIDGFTIRRYEDRAINLQSASDNCVVRNNTITFNYRYGVAVNGCSGVLVERNVVGDHQDHGIALTNFSAGCIVQDNECYRSIDPAQRAANGIYLNRSSGNLLQRNRTHDNQDTGLHIQSFSNNNLSIQNVSWNNGDHGFDHLDSQGTMDLGNVAYGNYKDGFSIEGSSSGGRVSNCIGIENGLTTNEFDLWVDAQSSVGFTSDYNVFWNSTAQYPVKYITTLYTSVAVYSAATGQDAHSIQADPLFVSPASANFHLQAGSPAIDNADSGVPNWPALDADGNGRYDDPGIPNGGAGSVLFADRGAYESLGNTDAPPVVFAPSSVSGDENTLISFLVLVSDPNGDPIATLTATGLPAGASFVTSPQKTSGTLSWVPTYTQSGTYTVTFTANNSLIGTASATITVNNVGAPPIITAPATAPGTETFPMTVNASASDPDGDAITSLTASNLPAGASFTSSPSHTSGTLTWTPTFTQAGSYPVTFTATNALTGTAVTTLQVANNDRPPVVSAPAHEGVMVPNTLTFTVTASDVDGDPIAITASGLPPRAHFTDSPDGQSGTFSWVTKKNDPGTYVVTFTAGNALSGTAQTIVTCTDVNVAPVVTSPAAVSVRALEALTVNVDAYDPDGQAITSLTGIGLPSAASFAAAPDNESGVMSWTPGLADQGTRTVKFRAANNLADTTTTVITVNPPDVPPVVAAPASFTGSEAQELSFVVSATDPDGDPIASLTASPLPSGASFTTAAGSTSGTLAWTPTYSQAGVYGMTFTATNAKTGTAATSISVADVDAPPMVTAPPTVSGKAKHPMSFTVSANDPDGTPLFSLFAEVPAGAAFAADPSNTSGTFTWTPGTGDIGTRLVTFTAQDALLGTASTSVTVTPANILPSAQLTVTPGTGNAPLSVVADAGGSSDADGAIVSYRFNFGDGTIVGPGPSPTATHSYAPGNWTLTLTATDNDGGQGTGFTTVLVAAATPPQPNLVGNPSFESNTTGWGGYSGGVIQRVAGGFDGSWALRVTGDSTSTVSFGCNDAPNWVGTVSGAGSVYRFTAWVRSQTHTGTAKIQVREYSGAIKVGGLYSNGVILSPTWQILTLDYLTVASGSMLDFQVVDFPLVAGEVFVTDNIGIRDVTGTTTGVEPDPIVSGAPALRGTLAPSPLRSRSALVFSTTRPGPIRVTLYDVQGRRVREVVHESNAPAGPHRYEIAGRAGNGGGLAAGVYFYRIDALEGSSSGRFVVLR